MRYELGPLIAAGGMGEVLAATDKQLGRVVAIKRMKASAPSVRALRRFFREAMIQSRLDHPSVVPVYELGLDNDGRPFFVMKKLAGLTLSERISQGYPHEGLLRAFVDVCLAIELAHSRGIVHRDLKPANIVIGDYGEVYVLDWGVARIAGADDGELEPDTPTDDTAAGAIIGTRGYMAPEQIADASSVDARADVYSLGCILFELLVGQPLHRRGNHVRRAADDIDARPSARGHEVAPELEALCVAATARDPRARIASARGLGERVQRFLDGDRDLVLRQDLALDHFENAQSAFVKRESPPHRRRAMREAARALALDPKLAGAAELVTRLMLEPPAAPPIELRDAIAHDDALALQRNRRVGAWGYLAFLAFVPLLVAGSAIEHAAALTAAIVLNVLALLFQPYGKPRPLPLALANAALVAVLAHLFSPFFLAPGIAALITMIIVFSPSYDDPPNLITLIVVMTLSVLAPIAAEAIGLLEPTMTISTGSIVMHGPAQRLVSGHAAIAGLVTYVIGLVAAAGALGRAMRRTERQMRDRLHLQTWQLSQLVPDTSPISAPSSAQVNDTVTRSLQPDWYASH